MFVKNTATSVDLRRIRRRASRAALLSSQSSRGAQFAQFVFLEVASDMFDPIQFRRVPGQPACAAGLTSLDPV